MDKVNLTRLFALYLEGLKSDGKISLPDILVQFIIPICCSAFSFALLLKGVIGLERLSAFVSNAIVAISIISGLMCALAVLIFQLRAQISTEKSIEVRDAEYKLIVQLFNDVLWDVVVGFASAILLVISSGAIPVMSLVTCLVLAISVLCIAHFFLVTAMCLKHLSIAHEVIAKAWSKR